MNLNSLLKMDYENLNDWTLSENKPNQTQNKPKQTQFPKIPKMHLNTYPTKDYENNHNWTISQNKPNQTQSKPVLSAVEWANCREGKIDAKCIFTKD